MSTTIESLRKLGLKVNGTEPTNNNIGNVINEIADDYQGGSGSAGVSSIGGVDGAITLGTGLSMSGQELQVSASGGGTQLYKHTVVLSSSEDDDPITISILSDISTTATALTLPDLFHDTNNVNHVLNNPYIYLGNTSYVMDLKILVLGSGTAEQNYNANGYGINTMAFDGDDGFSTMYLGSNASGDNYQTTIKFTSDTVTAL